jgi:signal peptidase II
MKLVQRWLLIAPVILSCVGCDQVTKGLARQGLAHAEPIAFFNNMVRLQYAENPGAFLSLGAGSSEHTRFWIFTLVTGFILAGMLIYLVSSATNSMSKIIALSLVFAGGTGNLIDRVFNEGRVIDFLNVGIGTLRTGVFNVADIAISFGVVWLFIMYCNTSKMKPVHDPFTRDV